MLWCQWTLIACMILGSKGHPHTIPQTLYSPQALSSLLESYLSPVPTHSLFSIFLLFLSFLLKYNNIENLCKLISKTINFHKLYTLLKQYLDKEQNIPTFQERKEKEHVDKEKKHSPTLLPSGIKVIFLNLLATYCFFSQFVQILD